MKLFSAAAGLTLLTIASGMAVEYSDFNAPNAGTTVITGVRGASADSGNVVITGSYIIPDGDGATQPVIYEGSLYSNNPSGWTLLSPVIGTQNITTSTLYGPNTYYYDNSLLPGGIRAVGSYKYDGGGAGNHGLMYTRINGVATWSTIDVPTTITGGAAVLNTIAHSTMGSLVVGNYDVQLDTGNAFVYNLSTEQWFNFNPKATSITDTTTASPLSVTAYGIWQNDEFSYTIAGGYSDLNRAGADAGYLVNYNTQTGAITDFTSYQFQNEPLTSIISHFDGIVATEDGFNLTGDQVSVGTGTELGFFASVKRNLDGSFGPAEWTAINVPGADVTSGNTVYGNTTLGVYVDGDVTSSYTATVPEPSTYALIIAGLGALLFFRRRQAAAL